MRDQMTWQCSRGTPFLSFLIWKTTARGWPASPRRLLGAVDVIEILLLGEPPLPLVGIDRQAVEVIGASRQRVGLRLPFGERAVQVAGDGAPHLRHLHPLVVLRIKKVRGEVLPEGALAAERDHGARSIIFMSAARITVSSSHAVFKRVGGAAVIAGNAGGIIQSVPDRGGAGEQLREHLLFDGRDGACRAGWRALKMRLVM